jgi:anti-repressor protein
MHDLMTIATSTIAGASVPTVNARDLHANLEVKRDFSTWIKGRIEHYGFEAGRDYITATNLSSPNLVSSSFAHLPGLAEALAQAERASHGGARPQKIIDYHLTLDMAKELAMIENTPKGRAARRYFIAAEDSLRQRAPVLLAALMDAHPEWVKIRQCLTAGLNGYETARVLNCGEATVRRHKQRMAACGLLPLAMDAEDRS